MYFDIFYHIYIIYLNFNKKLKRNSYILEICEKRYWKNWNAIIHLFCTIYIYNFEYLKLWKLKGSFVTTVYCTLIKIVIDSHDSSNVIHISQNSRIAAFLNPGNPDSNEKLGICPAQRRTGRRLNRRYGKRPRGDPILELDD